MASVPIRYSGKLSTYGPASGSSHGAGYGASLRQRQEPRGLPISRPLVSLVVPAYNEAAILDENLELLCHYMEGLEDLYDWEILVVNDGSRDNTGDLAAAFASDWPDRVWVIHHLRNGGLGQALQTGFEHAHGDYVVTIDLDLSYSPDHIGRLLAKITESQAQVVVASPYMEGGRVSNVPGLRKFLSVWANRFLSLTAHRSISTLTGMVRVYDARFLGRLHPRSKGMDIMPEIIHKAQLLNAPIEEIPAHLHWRTPTLAPPSPAPRAPRRKSSMKILKHTGAIFFYGFMFRPVMFFFIPSLFFFATSAYAGYWALRHVHAEYQILAQVGPVLDLTSPLALAYQHNTHTFVLGGMLLMLGIQLFSLAVLSAQSKYYFEETFYLGSSSGRRSRDRSDRDED